MGILHIHYILKYGIFITILLFFIFYRYLNIKIVVSYYDHYFNVYFDTAIASISTLTSFGSLATSTQALAGLFSLK